jgi:hypothetical protein
MVDNSRDGEGLPRSGNQWASQTSPHQISPTCPFGRRYRKTSATISEIPEDIDTSIDGGGEQRRNNCGRLSERGVVQSMIQWYGQVATANWRDRRHEYRRPSHCFAIQYVTTTGPSVMGNEKSRFRYIISIVVFITPPSTA